MTLNSRFIRFLDRNAGLLTCGLIYLCSPALWKKNAQQSNAKKPSKILMVKFPGIGNIVMMLPAIKAVREEYPDAKIVFFTLRRNAQVLANNPYIDEVLYLTVADGMKFIFSVFKAAFYIRREKFDLILDFEQFVKASTFFVALSKAPVRVGFDTPRQKRGFIYNRKVAYNNEQHMVETFADIVRAAGIAEVDTSPTELPLSEGDLWKSEGFFAENSIKSEDLLIGMHPGCGENFQERRWPVESFARVADRLIEDYNAKIVITGSKSERQLAQKVVRLMKHSAINIAGAYSVTETAAIIKRCQLFFSNDTAPAHIGSAMGTKIVGFYGPNTPLLYGPRGKGNTVFYNRLYCSPCITNFNQKASTCRHPICIRSISPGEVFDVVRENYFAKGYFSVDERLMQIDADWTHTLQEPEKKCPVCGSQNVKVLFKLPKAKYPHFFGDILKCRKCRLVFRQLFIHNQQELWSFYDDEYFKEGYLKDYNENYTESLDKTELQLYERTVRNIREYRKTGRVLDVGCATGVLLDIAGKDGWKGLYGVDISPYAAFLAQENFGIKMHVGTIHDAPFEKGSFDAIFIWDTIEHLQDPLADIKKINYFLREGGAIIVVTQNRRSLLPRIAWLSNILSFGIIQWPLYALYDNCHTFFFEVKTLRSLLKRSGFEITEIERRPANTQKRVESHYPVNHFVKAGVRVINMFDSLFKNGYRITIYAKKTGEA